MSKAVWTEQNTNPDTGAEIFGRNGYVKITQVSAYQARNEMTYVEVLTSRAEPCKSFSLKLPTKDFVNFCKKVVENNQE